MKLTPTAIDALQERTRAHLVVYSTVRRGRRVYVTAHGSFRPTESKKDRAYMLGYFFGHSFNDRDILERFGSLLESGLRAHRASWDRGVREGSVDLFDMALFGTMISTDEVAQLPTLSEGREYDLKVDTGRERGWLHRVTGDVIWERLFEDVWETVEQ